MNIFPDMASLQCRNLICECFKKLMFVLDVQQCAAPGLQVQYSPPAMIAHVLSGVCWTCVRAENVRGHNAIDPILFGSIRFTAHASQILWVCTISMKLPRKI